MLYQRKNKTVNASQFLSWGEPPKGIQFNDMGRPYVVTIHKQACFVEIGDWILPEPDGLHYYPVKDEIFKASYQLPEPGLFELLTKLYEKGITIKVHQHFVELRPHPTLDTSPIIWPKLTAEITIKDIMTELEKFK